MPYWAWIVVAFGGAAAWGFAIVLNKRTLQYLDPIALNLILGVPVLVLLAIVSGVLTLTGAWNLGFGMTWQAFGYISASSVVTWLIAFNAYYLVLRRGTLGVLTPILATDTLFTAVFAVLLLGSRLGGMVIAGLVVSMLGVVLLSHWMDGEPDAAAVGAAAGAAAPAPQRAVVALARVAAVGWGLGPVFIELATSSLGGVSLTMILQSQAMGALLLLPIVWRRHRITVRPLQRRERRLVARLVLITAVIETFFAVSYYMLISQIGSVLTVLIIASSPVFSILGGRWLLGERYRWKLAIGAAVTLAGVIIATLQVT